MDTLLTIIIGGGLGVILGTVIIRLIYFSGFFSPRIMGTIYITNEDGKPMLWLEIDNPYKLLSMTHAEFRVKEIVDRPRK